MEQFNIRVNKIISLFQVNIFDSYGGITRRPVFVQVLVNTNPSFAVFKFRCSRHPQKIISILNYDTCNTPP